MNFYEWQLKHHLISMVFNQFKIEIQFFATASSFPNFDGPNVFSKFQQVPGGRKIAGLDCLNKLLFPDYSGEILL